MTVHALFHCAWETAEEWLAGLEAADPAIRWRTLDTPGDPAEVAAAAVWAPPRGWGARFPALKVVCSLGAGVDHIWQHDDPPAGIPITRIVDPLMAQRMATYVAAAVLRHHRRLDVYQARQATADWTTLDCPDAQALTIGLLGLGTMGRSAARALTALGYRVVGWSRRPRRVDGIETRAGAAGLDSVLADSDYLVLLLPLTPETDGLIDAARLSRAKRGAYLINSGRGALVDDAALLAALDAGHLAGATLDVFASEPLPAGHPYWTHPRVFVTPHVASLSNPATGAPQIVQAIHAAVEGREIANRVDPDARY